MKFVTSIQEMHEDSIEFSSSTDKGAVGFILAQELAILTTSTIQFTVAFKYKNSLWSGELTKVHRLLRSRPLTYLGHLVFSRNILILQVLVASNGR